MKKTTFEEVVSILHPRLRCCEVLHCFAHLDITKKHGRSARARLEWKEGRT
jgi:hypothetical protein